MPVKQFVWYELVTSDIDAALAFYCPLLGWEAQDFPGEGPRYAIVSAAGEGVGGVMALPDGMSAPFWTGYIGTPDIDGAVSLFTASGATLQRGPWEVPKVGRLALVADPQGAGLAFIQPLSGEPCEVRDQHRPGHGNWNELHTTDPNAAFTFYAAQFEWTKGDTMDMGPMGTYQIVKAGDVQIGGMMTAQEGRRPGWLHYFGTTDIHGAVARIQQTRGTVLHGPMEVPGGAMIVQAQDPQGAMFALVGPA